MNGSVLGALRLDDSDSLRSEILRAEAEFTVSVSAVEGIHHLRLRAYVSSLITDFHEIYAF